MCSRTCSADCTWDGYNFLLAADVLKKNITRDDFIRIGITIDTNFRYNHGVPWSWKVMENGYKDVEFL